MLGDLKRGPLRGTGSVGGRGVIMSRGGEMGEAVKNLPGDRKDEHDVQ